MMICLTKISRQHLIYSFLFLVFLFCFSLLGLSSDSYAVSGTCTVNISISNTSSGSSSFCTSDPVYLRLDSISINITSSTNNFSNVSFYIASNTSAINGLFSFFGSPSGFSGVPSVNNPFIYSNSSPSSSILPNFYSLSGTSTVYNNYLIYLSFSRYPSVIGTAELVFTYSDNIGDFGSGDCPDPSPCPEIPVNPYDQKLEDIKRAIIIVGAVPLVIYFFVCVYKIIVKDGGSRR